MAALCLEASNLAATQLAGVLGSLLLATLILGYLVTWLRCLVAWLVPWLVGSVGEKFLGFG